MTNNYLNTIQERGYLVLDKNSINLPTSLVHDIDSLFAKYRTNEESLFQTARVHNMGSVSVNDNVEFSSLVEENENDPNWFQIWKSSPILDEDKNLVELYNSKIVDLIYGVIPSSMHYEFTCFRRGCGIKSHKDSNDDHNPNRLCVVLSYFSKDWKHEFGGTLILNETEEIVPNENTIVILDFTKNNIPHEVSKVLVDKNRLSLTTFIDYKNKL